MFPISKYKFYTDGEKKVIAVSSYAGQTVRGTAICHDDDKFDLEKGKQIAAARCAKRIAKKRINRAFDKVEQAWSASVEADMRLNKMQQYQRDAEKAYDEAIRHLNKVLEESF